MAMIFLDEDIDRNPAFKRALATSAKFRVADSCTSNPLFRATDVSFQQISGRWVMVVQLDSNAAYLQHEVNDQCEDRAYIPRTEVSLQVYVDKKQCCKDTKDALTCLRDGCDVQPVNKHWGKRPLS